MFPRFAALASSGLWRIGEEHGQGFPTLSGAQRRRRAARGVGHAADHGRLDGSEKLARFDAERGEPENPIVGARRDQRFDEAAGQLACGTQDRGRADFAMR